jgi:hypothetical protein
MTHSTDFSLMPPGREGHPGNPRTDTWDTEGGRIDLPGDVESLEALRQRLAKATQARELWHLAHHQEKYLEACSMVDALELVLDRRQRARLKPA